MIAHNRFTLALFARKGSSSRKRAGFPDVRYVVRNQPQHEETVDVNELH